MALFSKKEKKTDKKADIKKTANKSAATKETAEKVDNKSSKNTKVIDKDLSGIILKPRITEKAAITADGENAYTFNVHPKANKKDVALAIEKIYKVVPVKVNMTKIQKKTVYRRGGHGIKGGGKKAVVFLKKGDKIEFV